MSVECLCSLVDCPSFDDAVEVGGCVDVPSITMSTGCDQVRVVASNGFSGQTIGYDAETHAVVGGSAAGDLPWGPCESNFYFTPGFDQECGAATECSLCAGEPNVCELP